MQVDGYVQVLSNDLSQLAALGDESTARAGALLAAALGPALGRRLQEALGEAALELSAHLDHGHVEVRIAGTDPELIYIEDELDAPVEGADAALDARMTLRLPEKLKTRLEAAAATSGVSLNTLVVHTLNRALDTPRPAGGGGRHRLSGYGRS
jgi:hypothetical protein